MRDRLPLLLTAAILLLAGGVRVWQQGADGWAFMAGGMLATGVWLAVELHDRWHR